MLLLQLLFNLWIFKDGVNLIENEFDEFITRYGKLYRSNVTEYEHRKSIFHNSLKQIKYLNSFRNHEESARFGLTQYSDLKPEEFVELISRHSRRNPPNVTRSRKSRDLPSKSALNLDGIEPRTFDWREQKVVSRVRNQGKCGACWAHSIVATVESMLAIKTGHLTELSVQQLVDCSTESGCDGGDPCAALSWMLIKNVSLETAADYPWGNEAGECRMDATKSGVSIKNKFICESFRSREEEMVETIAEHGPLIAAVDASTWQHYLGGTIQYHCYNDINHVVQITGYDLDAQVPFFKVRNTWDTKFGIDGYINIAIGNNLCGIAEEVSALDVRSFADIEL